MNNEQLTDGLFKSIADNLPQGIYVVDRSMRVVYANQAVLNIFPAGMHDTNHYLGRFLGCLDSHHQPDMQMKASCRNCELSNQHHWVFEHQRASAKQSIFRQFGVDEHSILKYLLVQTIPLDDHHAMVIIEDQSTEKFLH